MLKRKINDSSITRSKKSRLSAFHHTCLQIKPKNQNMGKLFTSFCFMLRVVVVQLAAVARILESSLEIDFF